MSIGKFNALSAFSSARQILSEAFQKAAVCIAPEPKEPVTILNCTWSDFDKEGARETHQDAARRAYGYFKNQSYKGPMIMVMVDSAAEANEEMAKYAAGDPDFYYYNLRHRDDIPQHIIDDVPEAAAQIKPTAYFHSQDFKDKLEWVREVIDPLAESPLANTRPPLGSKRNFGMAIGDHIFEKRGLKNAIITYFDDDIYKQNYVRDAVRNLMNGKVFTAEVSYLVAFPQAVLDKAGEFVVKTGEYIYGGKKVQWLNELGHEKTPEKGDVLSDLPFGFTYAVRRDAVKAIGGVMDILRGEDRSVYIPLLQQYGEGAINLRTKPSGNLVRLLGDNNSANAVHSMKSVWGSLKTEIDGIFEIWKPMLSKKYEEKLSADNTAPRLKVIDMKSDTQGPTKQLN